MNMRLMSLICLAVCANISGAKVLSSQDLKDLGVRLSSELNSCPTEAFDSKIHIQKVRNRTDESVDSSLIVSELKSRIKDGQGTVPVNLNLVLNASKVQSGGNYSNSYALTGDFVKNGQSVCSKSVNLVKEGSSPGVSAFCLHNGEIYPEGSYATKKKVVMKCSGNQWEKTDIASIPIKLNQKAKGCLAGYRYPEGAIIYAGRPGEFQKCIFTNSQFRWVAF